VPFALEVGQEQAAYVVGGLHKIRSNHAKTGRKAGFSRPVAPLR
jgi:hypothetical protein